MLAHGDALFIPNVENRGKTKGETKLFSPGQSTARERPTTY